MHLRGGTDTETLVRFDDLRLYNPYHLKDFFGAFSTIDPGIISDIRVYTGGFPVNFGDRSSGVVDIAPRLPGQELHGQALLSLFTAGVSAGGAFADGAGDWAISARRGNMDYYLDLVNSDLGEPDYYDLYAHTGRRINEWLAVSANTLLFDDRIVAFDNDHEEEAVADYRDEYHWLRFDLGAPDGLGGRVLAAYTRLESERSGTAELPGVGSGVLLDERHFTIRSLQADGWWRIGAHSLLQAGAEWRQQDGWYRYQDAAAFELLFLTPGAPTSAARTRSLTVEPSGHQSAAYLNWRLEPSTAFATDLGLRWDTESLAPDDGSHWSPRAVLMWRPREDTRLRLGWGRYYQAQAINELQVPDGERQYQRAQRATHQVASIEHDLTPALTLRAELYHKEYDRPFARHENLLNTLVVLPELKPDRILIAPDEAVSEGAEISLNYEAGSVSGWLSYTHSRVRDRVDGEWLHRSWDQRDYASAGLNWRGARWEASHGGDLAPRLADDGRRTADARAISAGRRREAQCGADLGLPASRCARRPPVRTRIGGRADGIPRGHQPVQSRQRLLRRVPARGRRTRRSLPRRRGDELDRAGPVRGRRLEVLIRKGTHLSRCVPFMAAGSAAASSGAAAAGGRSEFQMSRMISHLPSTFFWTSM